MPSPGDDAPLSPKQDNINQDQSKYSLDEMEETTDEDYASSVDSMATASTLRPSAIHDPSNGPTSLTRNIEADDARASDTESSLEGAITPKCGKPSSHHLFFGTGGSSEAKIQDTDVVHFEADIDGILEPQRTDSFTSCDIRKAFQYPQAAPLSSVYGSYPINLKSHILNHLDRRSSGSSTFTSETPGLTDMSRATTFSEQGSLFDDTINHLSESPATTPGFGQRFLAFKDSEDSSRPQDQMRPPHNFTKEPMSYLKSPLGKSVELGRGKGAQYEDYRSPKPPISDSDDSEGEVDPFHFSSPFLLDSDNESSVSDSDYSDQFEDIDENHPLYEIKTAVVRQALLEYRQWKTSTSGSNEKTSAPNQSSNGRTTGNNYTPPRGFAKRQREEGNGGNAGDEDGDGGDDEPPQKKQAPSPANNNKTPTPPWACPFAKGDYANHEACYSHLLKRIKDVKQHLERKHAAPVYCARCRETFPGEAEREEHSRQQEGCKRSDGPVPEGMTPAQREKLKKKARKTLSQEEQWYEIFYIFFEGAPRPKSPYIPVGLHEKLISFVDMMHEKGPQIIKDIGQSRLMNLLGEIGLNTTEDEEHAISQLLSASITDGLQEITRTWKSSCGISSAEPSLTEGGTAPSSNQPSDVGVPVSAPALPNMEPPPVPAPNGHSAATNNMMQEPAPGDSLVHYPDQTPNLTGGEWTNIDPAEPKNSQGMLDDEVMDQEMWDTFINTYNVEQARPIQPLL